MFGFAQRLLEEKGIHLPYSKVTEDDTWPILQKCVRLNLLPYVDYALARAMLKDTPYSSEAAAAFICHLSLSTRQGNLCIHIENHEIIPDPRKSWKVLNDASMDADSPEIQILLEQIASMVMKGSFSAHSIDLVVQNGHSFYLQKYWVLEKLFIQSIKHMLLESPKIVLDHELITQGIAEQTVLKILLPEQADAILSIVDHRLTILTGGPGTGKTYTAGQMIKWIWKSLDDVQKSTFQIALAAPTGKAVANLHSSITKSIGSLEGFPEISATTLHGLLKIKGPKSVVNLDHKLAADFILIDECSMVDVKLMAYLLASIKPGARLVLLGDPYQLPSVEAGALFSDLVASFKEFPNRILIQLKTCMRAENFDLIHFANAIKEDNIFSAKEYLVKSNSTCAVSRLHFSDDSFHQQLFSYTKTYFQQEKLLQSPAELLKSYTHFRILTPLRQGPYGVDAINAYFVKMLAPTIIPIMLTQNDYQLELYNGEVGLLISSSAGDYALFPERGNKDGIKKFPAILLPKYEYAYCISIHKSQGSEFDHVVMLVPPGSEIFGKEVFYTAATRAKKRLEIWGDEGVIEKTLSEKSRRLSGILGNFRPG